jgi:hypothetical protein
MSFTRNGYRWSGPYFIAANKLLPAPAYYLIIDLEGYPRAVGVLSSPKLVQDVLQKHGLGASRNYQIGYQTLEDNSETEVEDKLDFYRELYELD